MAGEGQIKRKESIIQPFMYFIYVYAGFIIVLYMSSVQNMEMFYGQDMKWMALTFSIENCEDDLDHNAGSEDESEHVCLEEWSMMCKFLPPIKIELVFQWEGVISFERK